MADRLPIIDNLRSERVRNVVALGRRSFRIKRGLLRVEGPQAVRELLRFRPQMVRDVYSVSPEGELWELAQSVTKWCHQVSPEVAKAVGDETQGIFAVCTTDALEPVDFEKWPLVILPRTQDPGNAGTIIRSADAFGAAGVVMCRGSVDVTSPKVIRSSAGSIFHIPVSAGAEFSTAARRIGGKLIGAAGGGGPLSQEELRQPHSWVFGNEAEGLTNEETVHCDALVSVPMSGNAESLNVGVAAGICLFASQEAR